MYVPPWYDFKKRIEVIKMTNIISEFWYGNLRPLENSGIDSHEMREIEKLVSKSYHRLEALLDEKQLILFEKYADNMNENLCLAEERAFCDGFSLGASLMAEAFCGSGRFLG